MTKCRLTVCYDHTGCVGDGHKNKEAYRPKYLEVDDACQHCEARREGGEAKRSYPEPALKQQPKNSSSYYQPKYDPRLVFHMSTSL